MSTVESSAESVKPQTLHGVIRGRMIELEGEPQLPDGQHVCVKIAPLPGAPADPQYSPEVVALACAQQVEQYLPKVLEMTRHIFPSAQRLHVIVEEDPDIADDRHIVIEVEVAGLNVERAVKARRQWCREIFQCCPAPLVCVFRLALELVK